MLSFLTVYGDTEGPLGFPMADADAKALDQLLDTLPEVDYRRLPAFKGAPPDLIPGERADVSWITTETPDRQREIVLAAGVDDSQFKGNPIVTLAHDDSREPVGRSAGRRRTREGDTRGIKAKTHYPPRPDQWPDGQEWAPDRAFAFLQAGLMQGKSIGFLTLEASPPTDAEVQAHPEWASVRRVIRKCLLLEYACAWMPVNPQAVTEAVSKGLATRDPPSSAGVLRLELTAEDAGDAEENAEKTTRSRRTLHLPCLSTLLPSSSCLSSASPASSAVNLLQGDAGRKKADRPAFGGEPFHRR